MLTALNRSGQLISLVNEQQAHEVNLKYHHFYCADCRQEVKIIFSNKARPYFKHKNKTSNLTNESLIHQQGKKLLAEFWSNKGYKTEIESVHFGLGNKRRPDIFVEPSLALEFQCSPISVDLLKKRNDFYRDRGWRSKWFLGPNYFKNIYLQKNALKFLNYSKKLGFYLLFIVQSNKIRIVHHIRKYDFFGYDYIVEEFPLLTFHNFVPHLKRFKTITLDQFRNKIKYQLIARNPKLLKIQELCYKSGYNILDMPDNLFDPDGFMPIYESAFFDKIYKFLNLQVKQSYLNNFPLLFIKKDIND